MRYRNRARACKPWPIGLRRGLADDGKRSSDAGRSLGVGHENLIRYRDRARACKPCRIGFDGGLADDGKRSAAGRFIEVVKQKLNKI